VRFIKKNVINYAIQNKTFFTFEFKTRSEGNRDIMFRYRDILFKRLKVIVKKNE
jgi:hypothetical protein